MPSSSPADLVKEPFGPYLEHEVLTSAVPNTTINNPVRLKNVMLAWAGRVTGYTIACRICGCLLIFVIGLTSVNNTCLAYERISIPTSLNIFGALSRYKSCPGSRQMLWLTSKRSCGIVMSPRGALSKRLTLVQALSHSKDSIQPTSKSMYASKASRRGMSYISDVRYVLLSKVEILC